MTSEKTKLLQVQVQQQNNNNCTSTTRATRTNNNDNNGKVIITSQKQQQQQQQKYGIITTIVVLMMLLVIYSYPPATSLYKQHKSSKRNDWDNYSNSIRFISTTPTTTTKKSVKSSFKSVKTKLTTTTTPVFGILAQPISKVWDPSINNKDTNSTTGEYTNYYIAASYIKWLEVSGIRTIHIPYDTTNVTLLDEIFYEINGIFLPGGGSSIPFAVEYLFTKTIHSNIVDNLFFPIWGTCLGFEFIIQFFGCNSIQNILTNNITYSYNSTNPNSILETGYLTENISLPLLNVQRTIPTNNNDNNNTNDDNDDNDDNTFYRNGLYNDNTIYSIVTNYNVTMNNHFLGISPTKFLNNTNLNSIFYITSSNIDDKSSSTSSTTQKEFVSTIEPINSDTIPIYGIQYHPEKNTFEYSTYPNTNMPVEAIDHSSEGITMSLYISQYIREQLAIRAIIEQGNTHYYTGKFPTVTTYPIYPSFYFEQIYVIPK